MHDDLLASKPEGAKHDSDICPFCVEAAQDSTTSRIPPGSAGPDVSDETDTPSTEGGTPNPMSDNANTMTMETHEALQAKAVTEAVASADKALETAQATIKDLETKVEKLEGDNAGLTTDNDRLNGELDTAQVSLKQATEKVTQLEADVAAKDEAAAKSKVAEERAAQVKNLKLYDDEYVAERASKWAELTDTAWAERLDEWSKLAKPSTEETKNSDTAASALSGTTEDLTKTNGEPGSDAASEKTTARRSVLGLVGKVS